jgi:3-hydroxypropanoate dehydrogenase
MASAVNTDALNQIFTLARSHYDWLDKPVSEEQVHEIYNLMKMCPTSANSSPLRLVFVRSDEAKERILPYIMDSNREKSRKAPICVILAMDTKFYDHIPDLFPHNPDARLWFAGNDALIDETAIRNSSLQGAYFMLAVRAMGLDTGPISGFDAAGVDAEFFPDGRFKTNFLCNIGYGDPAALFDRSPRFEFDEACSFA